MSSVEKQQQTIQQGTSYLWVKEMNPMARNFDCEVIVLQKEGDPAITRDGDMIYRFLVADKTGSIILSVWGEMGKDIRGGDILHIFGVNNKLRKGRLFISTLKTCKIKRVGQDTLPFSEKPNMSEIEYQQPPQYKSYNNNSNQQQQQRNMPHSQQQQQPAENNFGNSRQQSQQHRYPNSSNSNNMNIINNNNAGHPYNNSRGRYHTRGGYNNNSRGRGRGDGGSGHHGSNRYHQDLDNPM